MKRWVTLLLAFGLLFLPIGAFADDTVYTEGYFYYTIEDQSITIIGYFGTELEVTVPASIGGIPVNAIGPGAFAGTSVQVLHLPDTIREIGENGTGDADVTFMPQTPPPMDAEPPEETKKPGTTNLQKTPKPGQSTATPSGEENEPIGVQILVPTDAPTGMPNPSAPAESCLPAATVQTTQATATPIPVDAEAIETSNTEQPQDIHPIDPIASDASNLKPYLWVFLVMGGAVLVGVIAIVLLLKARKRG